MWERNANDRQGNRESKKTVMPHHRETYNHLKILEIGSRFGDWGTVMGAVSPTLDSGGFRTACSLVRCDVCGQESEHLNSRRNNSAVRSCGCDWHRGRTEAQRAKGHEADELRKILQCEYISRTPEYKVFEQIQLKMLKRDHGSFFEYGGAGRKLHPDFCGTDPDEPWKGGKLRAFYNFIKVVGRRPGRGDEFQVGGDDGAEYYYGLNTRWQTIGEQNSSQNKRSAGRLSLAQQASLRDGDYRLLDNACTIPGVREYLRRQLLKENTSVRGLKQ
jgi:hypothetical protein